MNKIPMLIAAGILGSFAIVGVGLVSVTYELTGERIEANRREALLMKFRAVIPSREGTDEPLMDNDPFTDRIAVQEPDLLGAELTQVYRVRNGGEPVAAILSPVVADGYAGTIRLLVSVKADGSLGGVRVLQHHETPGLGDKIDERKSDWVKEQFNGRSLGEPPKDRWLVKRDGGDFDQFTGATVTPRAIVNAVKNTLLFVNQRGDALYEPPSQPEPDQPEEEAS